MSSIALDRESVPVLKIKILVEEKYPTFRGGFKTVDIAIKKRSL